ncbi:MAG: DapH/DapD/GlmU-related protein [Pseudomonadota bacterium]|nr:DapH/DapD/GlmU-related protein [Pseudomonadota bacterium]
MRKIKPGQVLVFSTLLSLAIALAILSTQWLVGDLGLGDFRGIILLATGVGFLYIYAIALYRLLMARFPLLPGEVRQDSRQEFIYHVHVLFYLLLFYPVIRSGIPPAPFMRLFYQALGARLGNNTYSQGIIHDPLFVSIGHDSVVGQGALLIPHVIEGDRLAHYPIRIGDHVTIGANAAVLSDVEIGDHAIVATGAVVKKGSRIGAHEVWGGVPARCIKRLQ